MVDSCSVPKPYDPPLTILNGDDKMINTNREQIYAVNADGTDKRVATLGERQGQIELHTDGG